MSSNQPPPDSGEIWLRRARSDLRLGQIALDTPDVLLEDSCFHAQQCAEKALKALLIDRAIEFPRTHVLEMLLDLLKTNHIDVPDEVDEAFELTQYAVQTRYPGAWEPVTRQETEAALERAGQVLAWVEVQLT